MSLTATPAPRKEPQEEVGRLLLIGFEGDGAEEALELADEFRPAGFVLFSRNLTGTAASVKALLAKIDEGFRRILGRPPILALDQEGGTVMRLALEVTVLPSAAEMADMARERGLDALEGLSRSAASALKGLGFNLNLAPILDVSLEGSYIGTRSFSGDPEEVSSCGAAFLEGHSQAGMLACGKHFPGLGTATDDPHSDLPVVDVGIRDIWDRDLKPFRDLSGRGIPAIMTTHAIFRAVDPLLPGTISPRVVDLLKSDVGFRGMVLTDDLEMGALSGIYPPGLSAREAVIAGHDLALVCRRRESIDEAREGLLKAVKDYDIPPTRLRDARVRLNRALRQIA